MKHRSHGDWRLSIDAIDEETEHDGTEPRRLARASCFEIRPAEGLVPEKHVFYNPKSPPLVCIRVPSQSAHEGTLVCMNTDGDSERGGKTEFLKASRQKLKKKYSTSENGTKRNQHVKTKHVRLLFG